MFNSCRATSLNRHYARIPILDCLVLDLDGFCDGKGVSKSIILSRTWLTSWIHVVCTWSKSSKLRPHHALSHHNTDWSPKTRNRLFSLLRGLAWQSFSQRIEQELAGARAVLGTPCQRFTNALDGRVSLQVLDRIFDFANSFPPHFPSRSSNNTGQEFYVLVKN